MEYFINPFGNIWRIQELTQDITDQKEIEKRASDPQAIAAMKYVQRILDAALENNNKHRQ